MPSHFSNIFKPAYITIGVFAITAICCTTSHCPDVCSSQDATTSNTQTQTECAPAPEYQSNSDETMNVQVGANQDAPQDSGGEFDISQIQPPVFADKAEESEMKRLNYAIGYDVGRSATRNRMALVVESFLHGFVDGMAEKENGESTFMSDEERLEVKKAHSEKRREIERGENEKAKHINQKMAEEFLQENRQKKDVVETESGLQYRIIKKGDGPTPKPEDRVTVHYRGYLLTGEEFDSSYKRNRPAKFPVGRVIEGWTEALQLMHKGAKWELFIPPELGYGDRGAGSKIKPGALLVFEVELIDILPQEQ